MRCRRLTGGTNCLYVRVATGLSVTGQEKQSVAAIRGEKGGITHHENRSDPHFVGVPGNRKNDLPDQSAE